MRSLFAGCALTLAATSTALAAPPDVTLTLAREGHPAATIVVAKQPTRAAQFAACELQWHLKQITGGDFATTFWNVSATSAGSRPRSPGPTARGRRR